MTNNVEQKTTRPWWRKKTTIGVGLVALSKLLVVFPATAPFAPFTEAVGMALAGYGIYDRDKKEKAA